MSHERIANTMAGVIAAALLALVFWPTIAFAQTGPVPAQPPMCKPELFGGTGKYLSFGVSTDNCLVVKWACLSEESSEWKTQGFSWSSNYIPKLPSVTSILRSGDLFDAMWAANVTANLPVSQELADAERAVTATILAKLPRWLVAPNSTSITRPVFAYTPRTAADGSPQIALVSTRLRAIVGEPCDCSALKHAPTSVTYCLIPPTALTPVASIASVQRPVAVCRLQ